MEHHLDRRVVLSSEDKYHYEWSLQELDEEGAKMERDLIPWHWSLDFTATELSYSDDLTIEQDSLGKRPIVTRQRRFIQAKLRPASPGGEWHRYFQTAYSMFGTDRTITDFGLCIQPLTDEVARDRLSAH